MTTYPIPHNPYKGQKGGLTDEQIKDIERATQASWQHDAGWLIGDQFIIWTQKHGGYISDEKMAADFLADFDSDTGMTPGELMTMGHVALAFPAPVRDLTRSYFDHYAGWLKQTFGDADGIDRHIEKMRERAQD